MRSGDACLCGSGETFGTCCGRFVEGDGSPDTAEQLMRSRYTAYTLGREDYLRATWHPTTRREDLQLAEPVTWLGLRILRTEGGGAHDEAGVVEFVARYKIGGRVYRFHEVSRFVRRGGRWLYVDGEPGPSSS
jgi:SEC-C motif-containing protein